MASGDTKTEAMLNVLGHGGSVDGITGSGNTKTQDYLVDAIGRLQGIEDEVEELKNNPDVVDIVDTYADLQAYDTSHLSDKDIIRVLSDETHSGNSTYYRFTKSSGTWTFVGEISGGGGATITTLTTSDYNWNFSARSATQPYDCVAIWLLPYGTYRRDNSNVEILATSSYNSNSNIYSANSSILSNPTFAFDLFSITKDIGGIGNLFVQCIYSNNTLTTASALFNLTPTGKGGASQGFTTNYTYRNTATIDNLTSNSATAPLAAHQGKVLKGLIDNVAPYNITSIATNAYNDQGNTYSITVAQYNEVLSAVQAYRPILFTKTEGSVDPTTTYSIMAKVDFVSTGSTPSINIYDNEGGFFALNYGDGEPDIGYYI